MTPAGVISTIAGTGNYGFSGDGGQATSANTAGAVGIAVDGAGNVYFGDYSNQRIRKVTPGGVISTVAGNGNADFGGDGGAATAASINSPLGMSFDASGNLYFVDGGNSRVRKVTPGGIISTVAGNGAQGYSGDGGQATSATLYVPIGVATDALGDLHIVDYGNYRVRKVELFTTCAAEGFTGSKLTMCQQVCEIPQSTATLSNLIKLYTAIYRSAPPCTR